MQTKEQGTGMSGLRSDAMQGYCLRAGNVQSSGLVIATCGRCQLTCGAARHGVLSLMQQPQGYACVSCRHSEQLQHVGKSIHTTPTVS